MNNSDNKVKKLEELKKEEEEEAIRDIKRKDRRNEIRKLQKIIELEQTKNKKDSNEILNKKRFDNDETYTWGELIMNENSFITVEETKEIWVYSAKHGFYIPNGDVYLMKLCANGGPRTNDPQVLRQLTMFIKGKSFKRLDDFTHPENLVNLKNGVLDMNNNKLLPKSPHYNFQNEINIVYNKNADCLTWEKTLKGMFKTPEDYERTQKWFGYHLFKENKEQVMHGFFGISGAGKSTMLHILVDLLGKENVTHFNLQDFNSRVNSYAVGRLYGKLANITFDMISTPIKSGVFETIKNLTSSDRINGRNIRESPFEFVPYAKLTFACNKLPDVSDHIIDTPEFKRRIILTQVVKKSDFVKNTNLYNDLLEELHSGGIFNWILEGRKKYLDDDGFNYDHDLVPEIWKEYMDSTYSSSNYTKTEYDYDNHTGVVFTYVKELQKKFEENQKNKKIDNENKVDKNQDN